jgi:DNA-directed RNA polymerase subunit RPC12/RpoP
VSSEYQRRHQQEIADSETGAIIHKSRIRCPKCGHQHDVWDCVLPGTICEEGEHDVMCEDCEHKFTIETSVSYSFESPEMIEEDEVEPEEDEE